MNAAQVINKIAGPYGTELKDHCDRRGRRLPRATHDCGDGLACYIVSEVNDMFRPAVRGKRATTDALAGLIYLFKIAIQDLERAIDALNS